MCLQCFEADGWVTGRASSRPVKSTARTVFLAHHDSKVSGSMLSLSKEHCYCHKREAPLKPQGNLGKAAHANITVFMTYLGSMVAACCPQSGKLSSFSALMLLVRRQKEHLARKSSITRIPKSLFWMTNLTYSNQIWRNSKNWAG